MQLGETPQEEGTLSTPTPPSLRDVQDEPLSCKPAVLGALTALTFCLVAAHPCLGSAAHTCSCCGPCTVPALG